MWHWPDIYKKKRQLLCEITQLALDAQKEFLKAFFDDEGCMDFNGATRRVCGYQYDSEILSTVKVLLNKFGIGAKLRKYEVVITGRQNLEQFVKEINFSPGVTVNGDRYNSIWKKFLEKRKKLETAVASYQKGH
ncbi:MAG: hypothetical protein G01um101466_426 [Parcubacteria group bacterium Gr01-1014_66]|nr:MAG: hypothetical protein G01um101466_426 [Parcubacteria group bacterium Gr01-1014_66]